MENRNLRSVDQTKPLIEYLEKNMEKGYKIEDLKWALISQGHSRTAVQKAVDYLNKSKKPEPITIVKTQEPKEEMQYKAEELPDNESIWQKFKGFFS